MRIVGACRSGLERVVISKSRSYRANLENNYGGGVGLGLGDVMAVEFARQVSS